MLCVPAGGGLVWQTGGNSKRCCVEAETRGATDRMQKAYSLSCWGEREINNAGRLEDFKNTVNFQLSQSRRIWEKRYSD